MIKAIIFDMDGVLVESTQLHFLTCKKVLQQEDIEITIEDFIKEGLGESIQHFFEKMSRKYGKKIDFREAEDKKMEYFEQSMKGKLQLRDGASKLLQKLYGKYILAVASSTKKSVVDKILKQFKIENFFASIIGGDEILHMKPAPDIYLEIAHRIGVDPAQCVAIEDSAPGMIAAKKAGMKCVAVPTEFTSSHDFSLADAKIDKLSEFNIGDLQKFYA